VSDDWEIEETEKEGDTMSLEKKMNRKQIEECKRAFRKAVCNDGTREDMQSFSKAWKEYRRREEA